MLIEREEQTHQAEKIMKSVHHKNTNTKSTLEIELLVLN